MTEAMKTYKRWLAYKSLDEELKSELQSLVTEEEIHDKFYKNLEFGTGGLRGVLGVGINRMNLYTVRRTTQGFADYINEQFEKKANSNVNFNHIPTVAIAYDSRVKSDLFAMEAAKVFIANEIKVYLYPKLMPTPALSYAVRYYQCNAGVMVTASHNPAEYNGYKVYNEEGCQMTLDAAEEIQRKIEKIDVFDDIKIPPDIAMGNNPVDEALKSSCNMLEMIPDRVTEAYLKAVKEESTGALGCDQLSVVYTPLNGTGNLPVRRILQMIGVTSIEIVKEQELPDGNFTTCPYPNPEKKEALKLGLELCNNMKEKPDLLLATDPDCDRVGIAVKHKDSSMKTEEFSLLTGNQVGVLLLDFICQRRKSMPFSPIAIKTIVSSRMVEQVAKEYGVTIINVLTGFKFIGEQIGILERNGEAARYIFGFEESYGYLSGAYVRDKDAVNASMLICEMTAYYKNQGKTLLDKLKELYEKHGYYQEELLDFNFEGAVGMEKMQNIIHGFRQEPLTAFLDKKVVEFADYKISKRNIFHVDENSSVPEIQSIALPKSDVLEYVLEDGSSFLIRPSGTEPKLKIYLSAKGDTMCESQQMIEQLKKELTRFVLNEKRLQN